MLRICCIFFLIIFLQSCKNQYLVGYFGRQGFTIQCKWKERVAVGYEPKQVYLDSIRRGVDSFDVKLFLGTWCNDSRKWVPRLFAIQNRLPIRNLEIISVDTTKKDERGWTKEYGVDSIPMFVFMREGQEVGRIKVKPSKPKRNLEKAIYLQTKRKQKI